MALMRFFKIPKHQQFEYKPRYWNPEKDDLKHRLEMNRKIREGDPEAMKARIAAGLKRQYRTEGTFRSRQNFRSNMLLIGVIAILLILTYVFFTIYIPEILNVLEPANTGDPEQF